MIAECVLNEAQAPGLRADLEARPDHSLTVGVAWAEHHPVLAKGDRPPVAVGRDVPDGQCRHDISVPRQKSCRIRANSTPADAFGVSSWGPRGLVLSTKVDLLASVRRNCPQGRRGDKWGPRPTELRRRSVANPAITSFGRFRQHHHRRSSLKKSTATVVHPPCLSAARGRARTQPFLQLRPPPPTRDVVPR